MNMHPIPTIKSEIENYPAKKSCFWCFIVLAETKTNYRTMNLNERVRLFYIQVLIVLKYWLPLNLKEY